MPTIDALIARARRNSHPTQAIRPTYSLSQAGHPTEALRRAPGLCTELLHTSLRDVPRARPHENVRACEGLTRKGLKDSPYAPVGVIAERVSSLGASPLARPHGPRCVRQIPPLPWPNVRVLPALIQHPTNGPIYTRTRQALSLWHSVTVTQDTRN